MRNTLHHLDMVELHAPNFDSDIDSGSDGPIANHQDIPTGSESSSILDHNSSDYRLPPLISDRLKPV